MARPLAILVYGGDALEREALVSEIIEKLSLMSRTDGAAPRLRMTDDEDVNVRSLTTYA